MTGISIHVGGTTPVDPHLETRIRNAAVAAVGIGPRSGAAPESVELSVSLVDAATIRDLNARYHEVDAETDVLAFDLGTVGRGEPSLIGDVYVCLDVAEAAAAEHRVDPPEEILRLVIHAVLHLLGYDHPDGVERYDSDMFQLQERLLSTI